MNQLSKRKQRLSPLHVELTCR